MLRHFPMHALLGLAFFLSSITNAQEEYSTAKRIIGIQVDTLQRNTASILFDKSLNTYHWTGATFYKNSIGPLFIRLNEQFLSTLIRTNRNLITDNQLFDMRLRYRLTDKLSAASNVSSFILSDNRGVGTGIGKASSHGAYGGVAIQPFEQLIIEPLIGIRFDKQLDQENRGISYWLSLNSDSITFSGYLSRVRGSFQYDKLNPRTLETHNASVGIEKIFFGQTRNLVQFNYYRNRRDFYLSADSALMRQHNILYNIESRFDNVFAISDTLNYSVNDRMLWTFHGNIYSREINRSTRYKNINDPSQSQPNTSVNELKMEGTMRAMYIFGKSLMSSLAFSYLERDEKHRLPEIGKDGSSATDLITKNEERKNNHARRTSLASMMEWRVSSSDTVSLSGSATILKYDTPSKENDDDRDELLYLVNLSTNHRINQHLHVHLAVDASLSHLVYLFAARSADNNWNRVIRLAPVIEYLPWKNIITSNTFEVLANYTVYDFESVSSSPRSYSFRQFAFIDSTSISITPRLGVHWFNNIRLYERGELQWQTFSERPVNYFEEKTYLGAIRYRFDESLLLSIGIRYFSQLKFDYNGRERSLNGYLRSIGPVSSIEIDVGQRTHCSIRGWYESQSQIGQPPRSVTMMSLLLNINL